MSKNNKGAAAQKPASQLVKNGEITLSTPKDIAKFLTANCIGLDALQGTEFDGKSLAIRWLKDPSSLALGESYNTALSYIKDSPEMAILNLGNLSTGEELPDITATTAATTATPAAPAASISAPAVPVAPAVSTVAAAAAPQQQVTAAVETTTAEEFEIPASQIDVQVLEASLDDLLTQFPKSEIVDMLYKLGMEITNVNVTTSDPEVGKKVEALKKSKGEMLALGMFDVANTLQGQINVLEGETSGVVRLSPDHRVVQLLLEAYAVANPQILSPVVAAAAWK